jgi:hypothetical protein
MRADRRWVVALAALASAGCAVGYDTTLFFTKSNLGIDIDTKPPTAEISIARREGVLAPGFEHGHTPPVRATFRSQTNVVSRFFFGVSSAFAGGDAAKALTLPPGSTDVDSRVCLSPDAPPEGDILGCKVELPKPGEMRPFLFATDTTFGLKVAWSGTAGQFPDSLKLGFNRKELAVAPVFAAKGVCPTGAHQDAWVVGMPSFLATLDLETEIGPAPQTGVKWVQHFATGAAATSMAGRPAERESLRSRFDPVAVQYDYTDQGACIDAWLNADAANAATLKQWWASRGQRSNARLLVSGRQFAAERAEFIRERAIDCH